MRNETNSQTSIKESASDGGSSSNLHPSQCLEPRAKGYGIGGGYERPYRKLPKPSDEQGDSYGPLPHSGYYGAGAGSGVFKRGQAGYDRELSWYGPQYGEATGGLGDTKGHS